MNKLLVAILALEIMLLSTSASADKLPRKLPVIKSTQCSSTGCWVHYSDGTSRFVSNAK